LLFASTATSTSIIAIRSAHPPPAVTQAKFAMLQSIFGRPRWGRTGNR
jgi:hypothetical protein